MFIKKYKSWLITFLLPVFLITPFLSSCHDKKYSDFDNHTEILSNFETNYNTTTIQNREQLSNNYQALKTDFLIQSFMFEDDHLYLYVNMNLIGDSKLPNVTTTEYNEFYDSVNNMTEALHGFIVAQNNYVIKTNYPLKSFHVMIIPKITVLIKNQPSFRLVNYENFEIGGVYFTAAKVVNTDSFKWFKEEINVMFNLNHKKGVIDEI